MKKKTRCYIYTRVSTALSLFQVDLLQSITDLWVVHQKRENILQRGLPFEVKMPSARPVDVSALSEAQMNAELEKGYADMQAGRTRSAKSVFADIRKDYNL